MDGSPDKILGANSERSRGHNRQLVLRHVRAAGQIGRAEIARAADLSIQAVSNIIAALEQEALLVQVARRPAGRGVPVAQYSLNPGGGYALGIEVRPRAVLATLADLTGTTVFSQRTTVVSARPPTVSKTVRALRDKALDSVGAPASRLLGAGIVMPGPFGTRATPASEAELAGWQDIEPRHWFADLLSDKGQLPLPVIVENDANAAAMAEAVSGSAAGLLSFAYLYFGTGLGLGLVSDGRLVTGAYGNAGEIGSLRLPGGNGTRRLEDVVSRLGIERHLAAGGKTAASTGDLARLHAAGDPDLDSWLEAARAPLSWAVDMLEHLFDPEVIILGGAMPDSLIDALMRTLPECQPDMPARPGPRLRRGASGPMTSAMGAAALVLNQSFTPAISAQT